MQQTLGDAESAVDLGVVCPETSGRPVTVSPFLRSTVAVIRPPYMLVTLICMPSAVQPWDTAVPGARKRLHLGRCGSPLLVSVSPRIKSTDRASVGGLCCRKYAQEEAAQVFITDTLLTTLMCTPRSVYSWDIVITRAGGRLFFDKRDGSSLDLLTVAETSPEQIAEDKDNINGVQQLSLEATTLNQNFTQQVQRLRCLTASQPHHCAGILALPACQRAGFIGPPLQITLVLGLAGGLCSQADLVRRSCCKAARRWNSSPTLLQARAGRSLLQWPTGVFVWPSREVQKAWLPEGMLVITAGLQCLVKADAGCRVAQLNGKQRSTPAKAGVEAPASLMRCMQCPCMNVILHTHNVHACA